jgi:excisionase family DNA binding protein
MTQIQYFGFLQLLEKHLEGKFNEDDFKKLFGDFINLYQWQQRFKSKGEFVEELKTSVSFIGDAMMNGLLREISTINWDSPINKEEKKEVFLTKKEVAERCRVTVQSVNNWISKNGLIKYKVGKKVFIKESDLDAFIVITNR